MARKIIAIASWLMTLFLIGLALSYAVSGSVLDIIFATVLTVFAGFWAVVGAGFWELI